MSEMATWRQRRKAKINDNVENLSMTKERIEDWLAGGGKSVRRQ